MISFRVGQATEALPVNIVFTISREVVPEEVKVHSSTYLAPRKPVQTGAWPSSSMTDILSDSFHVRRV